MIYPDHLQTGSVMIIRKILAGFSLLALLLVGGCDDPVETEEKSSEPSSGQEIKIALVMKTLTNPFFVSMEQGARQAAIELDVTLLVRTAAEETSATQQIRIVEQLVEEGEVQAIVIAPADSVGMIPALKKAQDHGILIVNLDNRLDPDFSAKAGLATVPFISIDNRASAYLSAKYIADQIKTPTKAAILEGIREAQNAVDRHNGAMDAFRENSNIEIIPSRTARWKIDEAYRIAKEMFATDPDIGLVFAANDMMALGVVEFLQQTNRSDVLVAGFDAIGEARDAISKGSLQVTIDQQPDQQGYLGVHTAMDMIEGRDVPALIQLDGLMVTQ